MFSIYDFHSRNDVLKKNCMYIRKTSISNHLVTFKNCVTKKKTYVNKVYNLLNPYNLTGFLSIPFDKLLLSRH